jgi:hypothetical protein
MIENENTTIVKVPERRPKSTREGEQIKAKIAETTSS